MTSKAALQSIASVIDLTLEDDPCSVSGWVRTRRHHGRLIFIDLVDSTGEIQLVLRDDVLGKERMAHALLISPETALRASGTFRRTPEAEILVSDFLLLSEPAKTISPGLRGDFDPHLEASADLNLRKRHLYFRHPRSIAATKARHHILGFLHGWFRRNGFYEVTAPILTPTPLYEDDSALGISVHDQEVFLTQCVGFYLESAVHGLERVYNIGPSFRGEESASLRHLTEYWHAKAELTAVDRSELMRLVELLVGDLVNETRTVLVDELSVLGTNPPQPMSLPFPRISYRSAISHVQASGIDLEFGASLNSRAETELALGFDGPFWVVGNPAVSEPFPYSLDPEDPELTLTADLILPAGYGELLGVAEKISNRRDLELRMQSTGRLGDSRYDWVVELRDYGCVAHGGIGMGVERLLRWLLGMRHVRDQIPFPRPFGRRIYP